MDLYGFINNSYNVVSVNWILDYGAKLNCKQKQFYKSDLYVYSIIRIILTVSNIIKVNSGYLYYYIIT